MRNHLLSCHRQDYNREAEAENLVPVDQGRQQDSINGHEQQDERDHLLVLEYMAKDMRPYSCLEDEGFRNLVKALKPDIQLPSRQFVSAVSKHSNIPSSKL